MKKRQWLSLLSIIGFICLMLAIVYCGPMLSKAASRHYREQIDVHGVVTKAVVYKKNTHKGNSIYFTYSFKGVKYNNHEQNDSLFDRFTFWDTVYIKLDTTNPGDSYVVPPPGNY